MSDLRAQVLEAMAQALLKSDAVLVYSDAAAALDAMLDVLGEQQQAWFQGKREAPRPLSADCLKELLAALRKSDDSEAGVARDD